MTLFSKRNIFALGFRLGFADWPNLRWSDEQLAQPLAAIRHRQGRLIGHMEALGFLHQLANPEAVKEAA